MISLIDKITMFNIKGYATDIEIIKKADGIVKSSDWFVQVEGYQDFLTIEERVISIKVNGRLSDIFLCLDNEDGSTYFLEDGNGEGSCGIEQGFLKRTKPSVRQIESLNLKEGHNSVSFMLSNGVLGKKEIKAYIFYKDLSNNFSQNSRDSDGIGTTSNDHGPETTIDIIRLIKISSELRHLQAKLTDELQHQAGLARSARSRRTAGNNVERVQANIKHLNKQIEKLLVERHYVVVYGIFGFDL